MTDESNSWRGGEKGLLGYRLQRIQNRGKTDGMGEHKTILTRDEFERGGPLLPRSGKKAGRRPESSIVEWHVAYNAGSRSDRDQG